MTLGDIVTDVRRLVNDNVSPYHWGRDVIAGFLRDAVLRLNNVRPSSRYDDETGLLCDIEWPIDILSFAIPASHGRWVQGFVYYAAARCLELDASDTANQTLAADFMNKAEARFLA